MGLVGLLRSGFVPSLIALPSLLGSWWSIVLAQAWPSQHNLGDCGITVPIFMWLEVLFFIFLVSG